METHSATIDTTLSGGLAFVKRSLQRIALDKAAQMYGAGSFGARPLVIVDGSKSKPIADVKPFGKIMFVPATGPIKEAAELAWSIVQAAAPVRTGHYKSSFVWYVNGRPASTRGVPDLKGVGRKGNLQLADLAPYAAKAEIFVPTGVLYAAFLVVRRTFGNRLSVSFRYHRATGAFSHNDDGQAVRNRPLNVPVLEIGSKGSNVRAGATKPGSGGRRARRARRKAKGTRR